MINLPVVLVLILVALVVAGFVFAGGQKADSPDMVYTNPDRLELLLKEGGDSFVLVDVRTPREYATGHIPGAINIPHDVIGANPPPGPKDRLVILYCRSGNRSGIAKGALSKAGYPRVINFGGLGRWKKALVTGRTSN